MSCSEVLCGKVPDVFEPGYEGGSGVIYKCILSFEAKSKCACSQAHSRVCDRGFDVIKSLFVLLLKLIAMSWVS